ncbi:MAG: hypothetical protein R3C68_13880 [Myxococcota bacterium]
MQEVEVGRIEGATGRLLARVTGILKRFVAKESLGLLDAHTFGMKSDGAEKANIA